MPYLEWNRLRVVAAQEPYRKRRPVTSGRCLGGRRSQPTLIVLTRRHELFHFALKEREFGLNYVPDHVV